MGATLILTPIVIASWPMISAAVTGAMAAMGFALTGTATTIETENTAQSRNQVEEPIENSEVLQEFMAAGEKIVATRDNLKVEFGRDERGACTICVSGEGYTEPQLKKLAHQISAKVVQQYTYHKVITELKARQFAVADEQVTTDGTIKLHVRRSGR